MFRFVAAVSIMGLISGLTGVIGTADAQQRREDGGQRELRGGERASSAAASVRRFSIPYIRSRTGAPRILTSIVAMNRAGQPCKVRIQFFLGNAASTPVCTLVGTVGPRESNNFCSRSGGGIAEVCTFICSPELIFDQGSAIVRTEDTAACRKVVVESRVYYTSGTTSDTGVLAISSSAGVPY